MISKAEGEIHLFSCIIRGGDLVERQVCSALEGIEFVRSLGGVCGILQLQHMIDSPLGSIKRGANEK